MKKTSLDFLLCFLCALLFHSSSEAALRAGAARRSLVPPFPSGMGGFTDRTANFTGVHDELFVSALVLDDGKTKVALVGSGLMALDWKLTVRARAEVEKATGIPAENILFSCAHNHSAPYGYQRVVEGQPTPLLDFMVRQFANATIDAYKALEPARVGFRAGHLEGASRNRQQNNDFVDTQVGVLRVERPATREIIAILFNFTAHPVIQGSENLLLSGEFPGAACRTIEKVLGGVAIFTQGAAGDVTINRSGDPWREIDRVGRVLAGEVIKTAEMTECRDDVRLAAAERMIEVGGRKLPSAADADAALAKAKEELDRAKADDPKSPVARALEQKMRMLEGDARLAKGVREGRPPILEKNPAPVQIVQVGDLVIVAIPGEIFVEYALELRRRVKEETGKEMILDGYANDYLGYIISPRAQETGGYEAAVARVDSNAARKMTETAMELVRTVIR